MELSILSDQNSAHPEEPKWTQDPLTVTRTTSSIVFTCLFTFLACAWSCIRPNIPSPYDSKIRALAKKLKILFWLAVVPELVACWTFRQWFEAGKMAKEYQYLGWTRRHMLFLMMGGFVLTKDGLPMQVVSIPLFHRLVDQHAVDFPTLTKADMQERSKFHPIFVSIVLFQAVWFTIQCVSRISTGLLITQLEVITLTLILSSAITFAFAWQKPLDVSHPVSIPVTPNFDFNYFIYQPATTRTTKSDFDREQRRDHIIQQIAVIEDPSQKRPSSPFSFQHFLRIFIVLPLKAMFETVCQLAIGLDNIDSNELPPGTLQVPLFYLPDSGDAMLIIIPVACALGMGIGVVHGLFWSWGYFPSESERLMWRASSVIAAGFYTVSFTIVVIIGFSSLFERPLPSAIIDFIITTFAIIAGIFCFVSVIPFVAARIILLVEAFLSLRSLPEDAFKVVSWIRYIPHFS